MLRLLDIFFFVFHTALILFNVFGWIPKRLRKINLIAMAITAFSWFALGGLFGYGWGYCFCTDWHWQVRDALGYARTADSYIQLLFQTVGLNITSVQANILAYGAFAIALFATFALNLRDTLHARRDKARS